MLNRTSDAEAPLLEWADPAAAPRPDAHPPALRAGAPRDVATSPTGQDERRAEGRIRRSDRTRDLPATASVEVDA